MSEKNNKKCPQIEKIAGIKFSNSDRMPKAGIAPANHIDFTLDRIPAMRTMDIVVGSSMLVHSACCTSTQFKLDMAASAMPPVPCTVDGAVAHVPAVASVTLQKPITRNGKFVMTEAVYTTLLATALPRIAIELMSVVSSRLTSPAMFTTPSTGVPSFYDFHKVNSCNGRIRIERQFQCSVKR